MVKSGLTRSRNVLTSRPTSTFVGLECACQPDDYPYLQVLKRDISMHRMLLGAAVLTAVSLWPAVAGCAVGSTAAVGTAEYAICRNRPPSPIVTQPVGAPDILPQQQTYAPAAGRARHYLVYANVTPCTCN